MPYEKRSSCLKLSCWGGEIENKKQSKGREPGFNLPPPENGDSEQRQSGEKKDRLQPGLFSETLSGKTTQTDRQTRGGAVGELPVQRLFNIGLALNIIIKQAKSYRVPLPAPTCSLPSLFSPQEAKRVYLKGKRTYTEKEKSQYSGGGS